MATSNRVVLEALSIEDFIQHVLNQHAPPSTLVVCSSKTAFLEALQKQTARNAAEDEEPPQDAASAESSARHLLQTPTLRLLSTSRTLKLAFCPDITHLRAYLATYSIAISKRPNEADTTLRLPSAQPILAILNPVQLHQPTSAFSAQGLNRTLSVAVEGAHHTGSKLLLTDIAPLEPALELDDPLRDADTCRPPNLWDEEVPILNATTKRLGELSVGRTVKVRTVAERWCTFQKMPALDDM